MGLFLDRAMTTPESHPAAAVRGDRIRRWRSLAWVAAILPVRSRSWASLLPGREPARIPNISGMRPTRPSNRGISRRPRPSSRRFAACEHPPVSTGVSRAQIDVANGQPEDALSALSHIPQDDPLAAQAFLLAGRIERQRNRMRAAEANFRKALACDPDLIDAHKELIYILGMQLRRREVDAEFKALARLTPLTHHELFTWGLTHFNFLYNVWAQDTAEHLESFILADPGDRYSRLSLATLLVKSPGAEARLEQILEPLPRSDPEAAALLIESRFEHGRFDEAMAMLQDTPADHPKLARIRGRVSLMRGDVAAAIRYFQDALTEEPYDRVAVLRARQGPLVSKETNPLPKVTWPEPGVSTPCTTYSTGSASRTGRTRLPT